MNTFTIPTYAIALVALAALSLCPGTARAQSDWSGTADLGYASTDGNSESETLNASLHLKAERERWLWKAGLDALSSSQSGTTAAERYLLTASARRNLGQRSYAVLAFSRDDDRFSGYDYQSSLSINYGYQVPVGEGRSLALELGAGQRRDALDGMASDQSYAVMRAAEHLQWPIGDNANLEQQLSVENGDENRVIRFKAAISSNLTGSLALKIAYGLKHTDKPPAGSDSRDTETTVSLSYAF